jgi:Fur family ferric uptake transcriptional regulator
MSDLSPSALQNLTGNQKRVLLALQQNPQPLSAQDLYARLRQQEAIGLATVYRALEALKLKGLIQHQVNLQGESLYQPLDRDRHSLTCLDCGQSFPLAVCPVRELEQQLQSLGSFTIYYHTLEFFGLCSVCAQKSV